MTAHKHVDRTTDYKMSSGASTVQQSGHAHSQTHCAGQSPALTSVCDGPVRLPCRLILGTQLGDRLRSEVSSKADTILSTSLTQASTSTDTGARSRPAQSPIVARTGQKFAHLAARSAGIIGTGCATSRAIRQRLASSVSTQPISGRSTSQLRHSAWHSNALCCRQGSSNPRQDEQIQYESSVSCP